MRRVAAILAAFALIFAVAAPVAFANDAGDNYNLYAARTYWQRADNPCPNPQISHWVWNNLSGAADWYSCQIWVNSAAYGRWPSGRACMIIMHEMGHLYGLGDSYNSSDPMYYGMDPWRNIPYVRWPCSW